MDQSRSEFSMWTGLMKIFIFDLSLFQAATSGDYGGSLRIFVDFVRRNVPGTFRGNGFVD